MHTSTVGYLPVPEWDGRVWQPTDKSGKYPNISWPEGFDLSTLPTPKYNLGQVVSFCWGTVVLTGEVRHIELGGGMYGRGWGGQSLTAAIKEYYSRMHYIVYANGHGRSIKESDII